MPRKKNRRLSKRCQNGTVKTLWRNERPMTRPTQMQWPTYTLTYPDDPDAATFYGAASDEPVSMGILDNRR